MANEILGRDVPISIDATVVGVFRTKSMNINNEPIDVTADGDSGVQRYLDTPGQKSVEISGSAMFDSTDETLLDKAFSTDLIVAIELDYTTFTIGGDFFMSSLSLSHEYNTAVTQDVTFSSSGAIAKTAV